MNTHRSYINHLCKHRKAKRTIQSRDVSPCNRVKSMVSSRVLIREKVLALIFRTAALVEANPTIRTENCEMARPCRSSQGFKKRTRNPYQSKLHCKEAAGTYVKCVFFCTRLRRHRRCQDLRPAAGTYVSRLYRACWFSSQHRNA